jgi:hypothetical protein
MRFIYFFRKDIFRKWVQFLTTEQAVSFPYGFISYWGKKFSYLLKGTFYSYPNRLCVPINLSLFLPFLSSLSSFSSSYSLYIFCLSYVMNIQKHPDNSTSKTLPHREHPPKSTTFFHPLIYQKLFWQNIYKPIDTPFHNPKNNYAAPKTISNSRTNHLPIKQLMFEHFPIPIHDIVSPSMVATDYKRYVAELERTLLTRINRLPFNKYCLFHYCFWVLMDWLIQIFYKRTSFRLLEWEPITLSYKSSFPNQISKLINITSHHK